MEKHKHLDYCLSCSKLLHQLQDLFHCINGRFYVCSLECVSTWNSFSSDKQHEIVQNEMARQK